jgi:hypothetical protein
VHGIDDHVVLDAVNLADLGFDADAGLFGSVKCTASTTMSSSTP